jgi:hypothetical protein
LVEQAEACGFFVLAKIKTHRLKPVPQIST